MPEKKLAIIEYILKQIMEDLQHEQMNLDSANVTVKDMERVLSKNDPLCCITSTIIDEVGQQMTTNIHKIDDLLDLIREE